MHSLHSRPRTTDRFIIACQESAGFTFQQNGPIWWANDCAPHPTLLSPTSSHPTYPASVPAHSAESGTGPDTCFCHKLLVSFFLYMSRRNGERTGHSDSRNHSVWIDLCPKVVRPTSDLQDTCQRCRLNGSSTPYSHQRALFIFTSVLQTWTLMLPVTYNLVLLVRSWC